MKIGDLVMIYGDPFARRYPEGMAQLVEKQGATRVDVESNTEVWKVKFPPSKDIYTFRIVRDQETYNP